MRAVALLLALAACAPSAPPRAPSPAASAEVTATATAPGGISREEADQRDVRHGGYAVGVRGPLRVDAEAGTTARIEYVVTNTGDRADVYDVTSRYAVRPGRVAVAAGERVVVVVSVPVPPGARGPYADVRVVVTSRSDAGVTDEATTSLHAS